MARQYRAEVAELKDGSMAITLRVDIQRGKQPSGGQPKVEQYRLGRCYLQKRLWTDLVGPLLVAGGFVIDLKAGDTEGG